MKRRRRDRDLRTKCAHCGKKENLDVKPKDSGMVYVGMGNHYCVECFARTDPRLSEKIWLALQRLRKKRWTCRNCGKRYRSDYALEEICDACVAKGWEYLRNLEGKAELRNWPEFRRKMKEEERKGRGRGE